MTLGRRAAGKGRDPDTLKVAPAVYVVVGETESIAREKQALIAGLAHPVDALTLLSEVFNYDFSRHGLNEPLSDEVLDSFTGLRGFLDRVVDLSGNKNPYGSGIPAIQRQGHPKRATPVHRHATTGERPDGGVVHRWTM